MLGGGQASKTALKAVATAKPDLVLLAMTLSGARGLKVIKRLRAADKRAKLMVVSARQKPDIVEQVLRAGVHGYVLQSEGPEELAAAIRDVLSGRLYVSDALFGS